MEISTTLVRRMGGVPFPCHITEYLQTTIFRVPTYRVEKGHVAPCIVKKANDFKVSVVTNPVSYLLNDSFSDHRLVDEYFEEALRKCCLEDEDKPEKTIFVVVQVKEDMGSFPVVGGQCAMFLHENVETYMVFDCSGARAPLPKDQSENISIVLTAVKAELEITDALEKSFDAHCFSTRESKCVIKGELSGSAHVQVVSPITAHDMIARSQAIKNLVARIESEIKQPSQKRPQHFGDRLGELTKALQLDPTTDDTFLRLWYLQLWERTQELGDAFRPKLQLLNDQDLKDEKKHRNDIAHYRVTTLDWKMLRSLQEKVFGILKQRL